MTARTHPIKRGALSRRRMLTITAASFAAALTPLGRSTRAAPGARAAPALRRWSGVALGAPATILLHHDDALVADAGVAACLAEIERLERIFSLYRLDSALVALNRDGALDGPPPELVRLMALARRFGELSDGAFDVTVQPLWRLHAEHFAAPGAEAAGPPAERIAEALALVDYCAIDVAPTRIRFARPGMAATLNGIAQGEITDRVAERLRALGFGHTLVSLGETRALDERPDGGPWRVGLPDPAAPERIETTIDLADMAVATSGGYATPFPGGANHIFDPGDGGGARGVLAATVIAERAVVADALSTTLCVAAPDQAGGLLRRFGAKRAIVHAADGRRLDFMG